MSEQKVTWSGTVSNAKPGVLIVGASFAGLATAWWMHRLGYAVTVVELAEGIRRGGTPVDIREEAVIDVAQRMGLLERIIAQSLPQRTMQFLDATGAAVAQMSADPDGPANAERGYEIERAVLLDMLFNEVKDDVAFVFGESVSNLQSSEQEVRVTFTGGEQRAFAMVFGCDGIHSAVRRMCFGEEKSFSLFMQQYVSLSIVNGLLIEENTSQLYNVPGKTVMLNAYNGKTDIGFSFFSEGQIEYNRRDGEAQKAMIRRHFQQEGWRAGELLDEMDRCDNFYFDKLGQIRMPEWSKGRIALVGDAGYCPSPAAGMGGSMALLGAAAIGEAFQKFPDDPAQAFQEYDRSLRPIVEPIQHEAVEVGLAMFAPRTQEAIDRRNERFRAES